MGNENSFGLPYTYFIYTLVLFDFDLHMGGASLCIGDSKGLTSVLLGRVIIPNPRGCSVGSSVLAKRSSKDTGFPADTSGGSLSKWAETRAGGRGSPREVVGMNKASGLPKAEPMDKGGNGSCPPHPPPKSAMLRDDARMAPAVPGS